MPGNEGRHDDEQGGTQLDAPSGPDRHQDRERAGENDARRRIAHPTSVARGPGRLGSHRRLDERVDLSGLPPITVG